MTCTRALRRLFRNGHEVSLLESVNTAHVMTCTCVSESFDSPMNVKDLGQRKGTPRDTLATIQVYSSCTLDVGLAYVIDLIIDRHPSVTDRPATYHIPMSVLKDSEIQ